jgi:DNA-binding response OmpR family regulator
MARVKPVVRFDADWHGAAVVNDVGLRADLAATRESLAEAKERIRWLEDALTPPSQHFDLRLPLAEATILHGLRTAKAPLNHERLARRIDVTLGRPEAVALKSIDVWICRLRKKLGALERPVTINCSRAIGYWIDDESKATLETLRVGAK